MRFIRERIYGCHQCSVYPINRVAPLGRARHKQKLPEPGVKKLMGLDRYQSYRQLMSKDNEVLEVDCSIKEESVRSRYLLKSLQKKKLGAPADPICQSRYKIFLTLSLRGGSHQEKLE